MPRGANWEFPDESGEKDVKEIIKKVKEGFEGIDKVLFKMSKKCHKEIHLPMLFVRSEKTNECYYVCRECLSNYLKEHPEQITELLLLRGHLTREAEDVIREWMRKRNEEVQEEVPS